LLVGEHPHDVLNLRLAAQLLGGEEDFPRLFHLARMERVLPRLAYLLDQATRVEPDRLNWKSWCSRIPAHPYPDGLLPHATRFAVPAPPENRRIPRGPQRFHWLRPHPARGTLKVESGTFKVPSCEPRTLNPEP